VKVRYRNIVILALRIALVVGVVFAGWVIYRRVPATDTNFQTNSGQTLVQIVLRQPSDSSVTSQDVSIELYPVDVVAVRDEFFAEPRTGKRFEDFLKERMKGRSRVNAQLDKQGRGSVVLSPGTWWLRAKLSGDEEIEWRLPVRVDGSKQVVELTPQNVYTRSKSF